MRILFVHNRYQNRGGEDSVVDAETRLLMSHGHQVSFYSVDNKKISSHWDVLTTAWRAPYSSAARNHLRDVIREFGPDIVHVHNFFPLITPAIYDACLDEGIPVVQTLHNYRLICPGALLMRDGKICKECISGSAYKAVLHGCYRDSRFATLAVARLVEFHRKRKTWSNKVNAFIALTEFSKQLFVSAGFPTEKIFVKPNFSNVTFSPEQKVSVPRKGALYVGRLSPEKGIRTLLAAWRTLNVPLRIVGDGPLSPSQTQEGIDFLGQLPAEAVMREMHEAKCLVMPSICYEGFPMVLVEAFAAGLPIIASRLGSMAEIVTDGVNGVLFEPGNEDDLAEKVRWLMSHPEEAARLGRNARAIFEEKYSPTGNYQRLMEIYRFGKCCA